MKYLFSLLIVCAFTPGLRAQVSAVSTSVKPSKEALLLKEPSFDFGKIQQGRPVTHEFEVVNTATDTLKLENVQASCGCTTPIWKRDPVAPGANSKILVGYNAMSEGSFEKLVTIYYNGGQTKTLTIKGNVYKLAATSAPQNTSIELLKQTNQ